MSRETRELIRQLRALNQNIDMLTIVTAINIGKEDLFKGKKTKEEKIEILDKMGLSNEIIALMTGSTSHSVSQFKSMKKPKPTRPKTATQNVETPKEEGEKKDEQATA